jgi:hypothetical protein
MDKNEIKDVVETTIELIKTKGAQEDTCPFECLFVWWFKNLFPNKHIRIAQVLDMIWNYDGPKTKYEKLSDNYLYDFAKRKYYTEYLSCRYDISNEEYENLKVIFDDDREGTESDLDYLNIVIDTIYSMANDDLLENQFDYRPEIDDKIKDFILRLWVKWTKLHKDCVDFAMCNPDNEIVKKIDKFLFFRYIIKY